MDKNLEAARAFINTLDDEAFVWAYYERLDNDKNLVDFLDCVHGLFEDKITQLSIQTRAGVRIRNESYNR